MKELVEYIIYALIDDKTNVVISEEMQDKATVINVQLPADQIGKVIGKNGRIATSIRNIVKNVGAKDNKKYIVKIGEN